MARASRFGGGNSLQRAQRADTRQRLIDGAKSVFARLGYATATTEHVLTEAGVSRASFYAHFPGKAALVSAIAEQFGPVWRPLYAELAAMTSFTPAKLREWCARHVQIYREHQDICIILTQAAAIESDVYWKLAAEQEAIIDLLANANLGLAHLSTDRDARTRAALVLSNIDNTCYFLAVRHWADDPSAGTSAMADALGRFLQEEARAF